jgi:hypothetical protein
VLTDTVPIPPAKRLAKITVISVAPLIGEAIRRIHRGESVGALFSSDLPLVQEMTFWGEGDGPPDRRANDEEPGSDDAEEPAVARAELASAGPAGDR